MKHTPLLDPRTKEDLLAEIGQRAKRYTPEWRFDASDMDAGAALAVLFSRMFSGTVDRFNGVLYKDYIEFLNLLGVKQNPVTPAKGYVRFELAEGSQDVVELERDTIVFHESDQGERILYMTDENVQLSPARLTSMVSVDPKRDGIALVDMEKPYTEMFRVNPEDNLQSHLFELAHDEVLHFSGPFLLQVEPMHKLQYMRQQAAERLADPGFATWDYFDGENYQPFDKVSLKDGLVVLEKHTSHSIKPDPQGPLPDKRAIRCRMRQGANAQPLDVKGLRLSATLLEEQFAPCDELYSNDLFVDKDNGGYCFGEQMIMYDAFYIGAGQVFDKRGANVSVEMDMHTIVRKSEEEQAQYEFRNRYVIDKEDKAPPPPNKYISRVVWEYWNGVGWTYLPVTGDQNPFGENSEGTKTISFTCPEDIQRIEVNARDNYWIRARVVFVENAFNIYATLLLPFLSGLRLRFSYRDLRRAEGLYVTNNMQEKRLEDAQDRDVDLRLFEPMEDQLAGLYLCFDLPPKGYPLSLYLDFLGSVRDKRALSIELFTGRRFEPVKQLSHIDGCAASGLLRVYVPDNAAKTTIFGQEGYFLRIQDLTSRRESTSYPKLRKVHLNAVPVTQRQTAPELFFSTGIHDANKRIRLDQLPVLEAHVWVNELSALTPAAIQDLLESDRGVRAEYDGRQELEALWVRWEKIDDLALAGPEDRAFELDGMQGLVDFGDGIHGRIPPSGEDNIRVEYSFGGGAIGNLPEMSISGWISNKPGINQVVNFTPICGGNDLRSLALVENLGPRRLKHRGRAVTAQDYEDLVLENFSEVRAVRCYPNKDREGRYRGGCVTVVVLLGSYQAMDYSLYMCEQIYNFLKERCDGALLQNDRLCVLPAQVMTVNVTASIELDALDFAAAGERGAVECIDRMLDPLNGPSAGRIGSLPAVSDFYAYLRQVEHVRAVRDVLLEGSYFDHNLQRVVALDAGEQYPFAVPTPGRHIIRI